jgi:hypothetical protein
MPRRRLMLLAAATIAAGCYQDDVSSPGAITGTSILIQGESSMLVGRTNQLEAIVVSSQHQQDPDAPVVWQNLDATVLGLVVDSVRFARVTARTVGSGRIVATSGPLADTLVIQVLADTSSGPSAPR